jgi:nicotinamide mononucleotide transporter
MGQRILLGAGILYSLVALFGAYKVGFSLPTTPLEVWIFISGAAAVWLAVKENVWNWPIGLLNVGLWIFLFWEQKLFANAGLQLIYIVSGLIGWLWWVQKRDGEPELTISNAPRSLFFVLCLAILLLSYPTMLGLISIGGAATYWDGLTTLLSLAGQYFLMKKYRENWYFWIVADLIYIGLFISQSLYLSAQLYFILLVMCIFGVRDWSKPSDLPKELTA